MLVEAKSQNDFSPQYVDTCPTPTPPHPTHISIKKIQNDGCPHAVWQWNWRGYKIYILIWHEQTENWKLQGVGKGCFLLGGGGGVDCNHGILKGWD